MHLAPSQPESDLAEPAAGAKSALALLLVINLFNYIDRQVLSAVLPRLQLDGSIFDPNDPDLQFKLGWLTSAFLVAYMIFSPIVGWFDGHGYRRWIILGIGVSVWSLASGSSGFATGYWLLFLTRCLVGIGEGAYGPVASAMLADAYPARMRGKILAIFNLAIPVGSALGFIIGGVVSDAMDDWRPAFWVTFSGLILGLLCFVRKEMPRPLSREQAEHSPSYWEVLKRLRRNRSFVICCAGMTAITYVLGGVAAWAPTYVFQRESRFVLTDKVLDDLQTPPKESRRAPLPAEFVAKLRPKADGVERDIQQLKQHLRELLAEPNAKNYLEPICVVATTADSPKLGTISTIFGGIIVVGGLVATALGAWLGERYRTRIRGAYFWVIALGALAALPTYLAFLYLPLPWGWVALFLAVCGFFIHVGPGNTILANVVTSDTRATAFAINILVIHGLGDVISPPIIGAIADASSMHTALLVTSAMIVLSGVLWIWGVKYLDEDTRRITAAG